MTTERHRAPLAPDTTARTATTTTETGTAASRTAMIQWAVPGAALVHLVVGLLLISKNSLWGDEAFTAEAVRLPLGDLLSMLTRIDVNMSAYYLLLHGWTDVFGMSEWALRLPSLLMSAAAVLVAGRLVSRSFGELPGAVTAIALALSPFFLAVGLTARPFAMLGLLTAVSVTCLVRALGVRQLSPWLLVALVDAILLYTSLLGLLVIASQVVYVVAADRRYRWGQVAAAAVVAVALVPTLVWIAPSNTLNWLVTKGLSDIVNVGFTVVGKRYGLLFAGLAVLGLLMRPEPVREPLVGHPRSRWLLPLVAAVPLLLMLAALPKQSLFTPPYLVPALIGATMLAGAVTVRLRTGWTAVVAALLVVTLGVGVWKTLVPDPGLDQQDWRAAVAELDPAVEPGDVVVFPNTFYRAAGEYYGRDGRFTSVAVPALPSDAWLSQPPDTYDTLKRTGFYKETSRILAGVQGHDQVWLVGPDDEFMDLMTSTLTGARWTVTEERAATGLVLRRLTRAGG